MFLFQLIGICFLATVAYENASQFVYSTNDSVDVQANKLLEKHLTQSFACANTKFSEIVGTTNQSRQANQAYQTLDSVTGGSLPLLQPLNIDKFMAYDEYWVPAPDAPQLHQVLYDFTIESIYGCLGEFDVRVGIRLLSLCVCVCVSRKWFFRAFSLVVAQLAG